MNRGVIYGQKSKQKGATFGYNKAKEEMMSRFAAMFKEEEENDKRTQTGY